MSENRDRSPEALGRDRGEPGGGRGRVDDLGRTPVYPGSGPLPPGDAETRTPGSFVHGQTDAEGRPVEGGSEISRIGGAVVGGATPPSNSPPQGPRPDRDSPGEA